MKRLRNILGPLLSAVVMANAAAAEKETAPETNALPFKVKNPSMTEGEAQPKHWTDKWIASGKISIRRDAQVFKSAPAALAVESIGGAAQAQAMQFIEAPAGTRFRLTAWARATGKANALVGIQSYTADWKGIEFKAVGNAMAGLDWQRVSGEITLPAKTARFGILLMIQGDGKVWLDDVAVEPAGGAAGDAAGAGTTAAKPKVVAPPKPANAWSPGEGFYPDYPQAWRQVLQGQLDRAKQGNVNLLFIGDSLTQGWDKALWKERFEPLGAVNFGVGGDGTPQVLYRIEHGILDGLAPKTVVLMIGINNTWPGYSAADTVKGITACVQAIAQKLPQTRILLLGVLPIFDRQDGVRNTIKAINAEIAKLADGQRVRFLDFGDKFLNADGSRITELYQPDRLHLTPKAYRIWADALAPLLTP
ncbi:MAG: GDSL-type esterase/lipase family protein [Verrucomicrobiota bacterium]